MADRAEPGDVVDKVGTQILLCFVPAVQNLLLQWKEAQRILADWFENAILPRLCCAPQEPSSPAPDAASVLACEAMLFRHSRVRIQTNRSATAASSTI